MVKDCFGFVRVRKNQNNQRKASAPRWQRAKEKCTPSELKMMDEALAEEAKLIASQTQ